MRQGSRVRDEETETVRRRREQVRLNVAALRRRRKALTGSQHAQPTWSNKTQHDFGKATCISGSRSRKHPVDASALSSDHVLLAVPVAGQQYAEVIVQFLLQQIPKKSDSQAPFWPPHHWMILLSEHTIVNESLHLAIKATALRVLSLVRLDRQAHISGLNLYGRALQTFRHEIIDGVSSPGDMIATALMMASFELMNLTAGGVQRWRSHVESVRPVMLNWARFATDDAFGRSLISCWDTQMVYSELLDEESRACERQSTEGGCGDIPTCTTLENYMLVQQRKLLSLSAALRFSPYTHDPLESEVPEDRYRETLTTELDHTCDIVEKRYGLLGKIMTILPKTIASPGGLDSEVDLVQYRLGLQ
ncbi:hypothetical protein EJ05DRAFT_495764 [Pseudovirgaria hyperparasitica]|uniref:Uncharacterized protein n=1 Tax=Pseudovirgaria hyperparasitica TaxID=470096 RepID=A0A6A6WL65_9PEZI|nr:uncharacterized protein EJ05DRAFT_495764 [Pseudovirgaria hyperparasitica]KAF2762913.1 hypothetical protein EJ05DRAFT_495764 [Pseudovirgaria hyperparasitica]